MKTHTVVLSYLDADEYYTHFFLSVYLNHDKARGYANAMREMFNATEIIECTDLEHTVDAAPENANFHTPPRIKIITQNH